MNKQAKVGEAYTYDREQATLWCYAKRDEGFVARFTAKKVGNRRLYTVRWFTKVATVAKSKVFTRKAALEKELGEKLQIVLVEDK